MKTLFTLGIGVGLGIATVLAATGPALAGSTLKTEVTIAGDRVRIGDLFEGAGDQADQVVAHAPAPGRKQVFDALFLNRVARAYRIDWRASSSQDQSVVGRLSQVVGPEQIRLALVDALARKIPAGRIDVSLDNRWLEVNLPVGVPATVAIENLNYVPYQYRFSADLVTPTDGPAPQRVIVTGRAVGMVNAPVLVRRVNPGDPITRSDLGSIETPLDLTDGDMIAADEQVIGQTPRHNIAINTPLRARDLETPRIVAKGAIVTMILQTPTMQLTAQGRALQAGAKGEVIRVVNTQSNRIIDATVAGTNLVSIARPGTILN